MHRHSFEFSVEIPVGSSLAKNRFIVDFALIPDPARARGVIGVDRDY